MNLFVFSDESGVFDYKHNKWFVFAGIVFLDRDTMDNMTRKYIGAEKNIRKSEKIDKDIEVKASTVSNTSKNKLYKSLKNTYKFGVVIKQESINKKIFENKKSKQRYLDYAYKIAIKRCFEKLIRTKVINPDDIENLCFYVDEHSTATNGRYELKESLEQEFKYGTFNHDWNVFHPPIFDKLKCVELKFYDSKKKTLVRAADIVANRLYYEAISDHLADFINNESNFTIIKLP